jgi:hypothetical protein
MKLYEIDKYNKNINKFPYHASDPKEHEDLRASHVKQLA